MAHVAISLLGPFAVTLDGQPVTTFESVKVRALLAFLAVEAEQPQSRAALAELLWPELPNDTARTYLRHVLANLKQALDDQHANLPVLLTTRDTVQFNPASDHWLDVAAFTSLLAACDVHPHRYAATCASCARAYAGAVALYNGEFLAHLFLADSSPFEEWAALKRERLRQQALMALERLTTFHECREAYHEAEQYARQQVALDPWHEGGHQQLMRVLWQNGQRSAALAQYQHCQRTLQQELGVEPAAETTALYVQIRNDQQAYGEIERQARGHGGRRHNLPAPTTTFVGRVTELAELAALLQNPACRLITLTGPGGVGKTRLALQIAGELRNDFADGMWLVELASVGDPELVATAIASTLGVKEAVGQTLTRSLIAFLRERQGLLILDNFEHLLGGVSLVNELLRSAPHLTVLATSRAMLSVYGEHIYPVPPLALPDLAHLPAVDELIEYEAVQLFIARVQTANHAWSLMPEHDRAVAEICVRLDGLPLAIELAAARTRLLPPPALLQRLVNRFAILVGGAHTLPTRHQTLRGAIDWSYNLLDPAEQTLFARLAVFVGGWTLEAAEVVCSDTVSSAGIVDGLQSLLDNSLVQQAAAGSEEHEPRFSMFETIREYALERLEASGGAEALRQQHAVYFLALAETAEPALRGPEQAIWLERLEAEHDNQQAALQWSLDQREDEITWRFCEALWEFWLFSNHLSVGRRWMEAALVRSWPLQLPARVSILGGAGWLAYSQGDVEQAQGLFHESLALARELRDAHGSAIALRGLGRVAQHQGDYARAHGLYEESLRLCEDLADSEPAAWVLADLGILAQDQNNYAWATRLLEDALALFRKAGHILGIAIVLQNLGEAAQLQGDYVRAQAVYEESLALKRMLGDSLGIAVAFNSLGMVAWRQGDVERARSLLEESLARSRALRARHVTAWALADFARIAACQGDAEQATKLLEESLAIRREIGDQTDIAWCLGELGSVATIQGLAQRAARLFGAMEAMHEAMGVVLSPVDRADYERAVVVARAQIDESMWAAAWAEGQAMSLDQVIAYALATADPG